MTSPRVLRRAVRPALVLSLSAVACGPPAGNGPPRPVDRRTPSGLAWDMAGSGPPVVLVHGALLDRRQWAPQQPLAGRFTLVRYDTRWHGRSSGAASPYRAAEDLAEVLDAAGFSRASIVGLSNGSRIALDFALAHPERVARLVLVSPDLDGYRPVAPAAFWAPLMAALRAGDADSAARVLAASPVMAVGDRDTAWVRAMVRDHARIFRQDPRLELRGNPPAIRRLHEISTPVLVVTGDQDLRDIRLAADTLAAGIQTARRVTLPGAGHLLTISAAQSFNRLVEAFLAGNPS